MDSRFVPLFCPDRYCTYKESGFYYLQSRYYDPALGRFLNADSYASTGQGFLGYNMFAYCENNPISNADSSGSICVCVSIADGGGGSSYKPGTKSCSSGATHGGSKALEQNPGCSDEEKLFQTCYKNTYGNYYSSPCGSYAEVSLDTVGKRTWLEYEIESLGIGALSACICPADWPALLVTFLGDLAAHLILPATSEGTKEFTVIEWEWRNGALSGSSTQYNYGAMYIYGWDNTTMTLTEVGKWHIVRNPYAGPYTPTLNPNGYPYW